MSIKQLREDIASVFERDPAARNTFEVLTTYPGLHAILHYRIANWLWRKGMKWLARLLSTFSRWMTGIEIHPGATIGRRFFIDHGMGVVIGETAEIGDDCTLYHGVTLGGTTWNKGKRHPTLRNGVVVGAGAKVLGPIIVGENARIGSNAVVTKEVPDSATVVGIPGRIIRKAGDETLEKRRLIAEKIGFDAYGIADEMPDPIARSIHNLMDHMNAVDSKIDTMCKALAEMGNTSCSDALPKLEEETFVSLNDAYAELKEVAREAIRQEDQQEQAADKTDNEQDRAL
ncbi:MAG: serine O-acetyltransferase [Oceanospirillaceae bacterium]|uniref:serine O-acetyltransferase n=1 Tax=unclassified Thalassolituus TaxID=2624967 RepID=UPI000C4E181F|nr:MULTISPECIES: serine O-acetyltransferase [unclassified Thalassolituus]MAS24939.1 serine O-acetyltransferase [Oceanospirillaceae bacterium]MAY01156.1 serine O-acetyltransferase [Oceanospirillaceae bacterium]MBL35140.1 serine O-acetyltransferase [Oceanospirillaceae bacterium]MBS52329.1 serine O-acetyltransferase [Oceanospirillaceae bacterium]